MRQAETEAFGYDLARAGCTEELTAAATAGTGDAAQTAGTVEG